MFAATLGILKFQFRRVRIHGHTLTLGIRETLRLELRQRARLGTPVLCSPSVRRRCCSQVGEDVLRQEATVLRYAPRVIRTKRAQQSTRFPGITHDVLAPLHLGLIDLQPPYDTSTT
jgi:hypothetical protein